VENILKVALAKGGQHTKKNAASFGSIARQISKLEAEIMEA
jgi:hypothetical protein